MSKVILRSGLIIAFIPLVITLIMFSFLPETIPTHFTGATPDAWSDKGSALGIMSLFAIPLVSILICSSLYFALPGICRTAEKTSGQTIKNPKYIEMIVPFTAVILLIGFIVTASLLLTNI